MCYLLSGSDPGETHTKQRLLIFLQSYLRYVNPLIKSHADVRVSADFVSRMLSQSLSGFITICFYIHYYDFISVNQWFCVISLNQHCSLQGSWLFEPVVQFHTLLKIVVSQMTRLPPCMSIGPKYSSVSEQLSVSTA